MVARLSPPRDLAIGALVGSLVVVVSFIGGNPGWGVISHSACVITADLGNVTVWRAAAIVASPYDGSESGEIVATATHDGSSFTVSQPTEVTSGNVTAYYLGFENWSVFSTRTVTQAGPGPNENCRDGFVAFGSPNPAQGLRSGGVTSFLMYANLSSDTDLPGEFNASQLCLELENSSYSSCAVSAQFDLNFVRATGQVDTCASGTAEVASVSSDGWPSVVPFPYDGSVHLVPLEIQNWTDPTWQNDSVTWYNYTFPAHGGIWQYDNLSQTSSTGAGLVFKYSPCP